MNPRDTADRRQTVADGLRIRRALRARACAAHERLALDLNGQNPQTLAF